MAPAARMAIPALTNAVVDSAFTVHSLNSIPNAAGIALWKTIAPGQIAQGQRVFALADPEDAIELLR